jgi:hypothetical protein
MILSIVLSAALAAGCSEAAADRDLTSPKAAALTFARAIDRGDADTARFAAMSGGIENDLLDAMALAVPALRKLDATARAKWSAAGGALVRRSSTGSSSTSNNPLDTVKMLTEGDVAILGDGTLAQISSRDAANSLQLKKIDGQWKVDVGAMIKGQDVTQTIPWLRALASTANSVAAQIEAGSVSTVDEAQQAMGREIVQNLREARAARNATTQTTRMASQ